MAEVGFPGELAGELAAAVKEILVGIIDFLTPIIEVLGIGMVLIGLMLMALRQEFYGIRLAVGGGIAIAIIHLVIPMLLGLL